MIWPHGTQKLALFMDMINSHHPTIKFTYEYYTKEIPFLDTIVYKTENNKLFTRASTNQQIINNIYTFTQPIQESKKNQSLLDC